MNSTAKQWHAFAMPWSRPPQQIYADLRTDGRRRDRENLRKSADPIFLLDQVSDRCLDSPDRPVDELEDLRAVGARWLNLPPDEVKRHIEDGALQEVEFDTKTKT